MSLLQKLQSPGSKRILSLDGGGIRGALTLGYLQKIEAILRKQHNNPNLRLCDYFDLIGGTSTGSIIAASLAIGMEVNEIKEKYFELGGKIFGKKYKWYNVFQIDDFLKARYNGQPLDDELKKVFGDITLGSDEIKTGLCIVAKRADTNSTWPIINHPSGKFFDSELGKNKNILLWKAVRASAAAPTYFLPQVIDVGGGVPTAAFVDGGVSMANNPALQLLMVANLKGFPFHWKMGAENILLVSVGTGMSKPVQLHSEVTDNNLLNWAQEIPDMLMQDASWQNQAILQWLSKSPTACIIDAEIGDMQEDLITDAVNQNGLLSYLRYNFLIEPATLNDLNLNGRKFTKKDADDIIEMSNAENRFILFDIGLATAEKEVHDDHFPKNFSLT
ncbi:MAG: patatin-like phospholipase family protein [Chitinophagaceae bacterium]|jgi:patatin-like phospholipase/acyl hydrolase|nr:patatin-like phospholipase family protein [Chitinophagaceae bacterium]